MLHYCSQVCTLLSGRQKILLKKDCLGKAMITDFFCFCFQADVRMGIHALKTVTTFMIQCMNVTAIEGMSSVTMVTAALVSFPISFWQGPKVHCVRVKILKKC